MTRVSVQEYLRSRRDATGDRGAAGTYVPPNGAGTNNYGTPTVK